MYHFAFYFSFRTVCYNILADTYADSDFSRTVLYPYCSPYALAIDYRKQLLLKEIIGKIHMNIGKIISIISFQGKEKEIV